MQLKAILKAVLLSLMTLLIITQGLFRKKPKYDVLLKGVWYFLRFFRTFPRLDQFLLLAVQDEKFNCNNFIKVYFLFYTFNFYILFLKLATDVLLN